MNTDHVNLSEAQVAFVAAEIARYVAEADASNWLLPYIEKYRILPLYVAWTETIGILPDGLVRKFSADGDYSEYEGLCAIDDVAFFLAALVLGAEKYPELQSLVPARPPGAVTCNVCHGSGKFPGVDWKGLLCECAGLGWQR